ncbi:unnamed protein product [Caenorhabditis brenneri]
MSINDLSIEIIDKILNHVDYSKERTQMRRVCRGFRDVLDHQTVLFDRISVSMEVGSIQIDSSAYFENYSLKSAGYHQNNDGWQRESSDKGWCHLESILKNPRTKLNEFRVINHGKSDISEELEPILKTLEHQIHVRSLRLTAKDQSSLIECFKPGVLEKIHLKIEGTEYLEQLYQSEQWKLANYREIDADFPCELPILLKMISQINVLNVTRQTFVPEEILRIREAIIQSPNFESAWISTMEHYSRINFVAIKTALGTSLPRPEDEPESCLYRIPGSNDFLEFKFSKYDAMIVIRKCRG